MPTALELGSKGWRSYIEAARGRSAPSQMTKSEKGERDQLLIRLRELAATLKSGFGAQRVILFGSLAHGVWFVPDSDVDLAVEGLTGENYWKAWRLAEEMIGDRPVDLIEMDSCGGSLRRAIERYGVDL